MAFEIVIIGTGFGQYAVAPAFEAQGCEVQLVSPRDTAAIENALAEPCDLVSIHSPPFMHLEHVRLATQHGHAVLCDKPFGRNADEAAHMLKLASDAGVAHFLNFEFRCEPLREKLKQLLDEGAIGEPRHLSSSMYLSRGRSIPHGWLLEKDKGGGWLGAYVSHMVDMLHWLFGEIAEVSSDSRIDVKTRPDRNDPNITHEATAEDAVCARFRMKNGVTALIDTAFSAAVDQAPTLSVLGSEGMIQLVQGDAVIVQRPGEEPQRHTVEPCEPNPVAAAMPRWAAAVCRALESGEAIKPDFQTGLDCARVLDLMR